MTNTPIDQIKALTAQLAKYSDAYYLYDNPLITDKQYDDMCAQLAKLEDSENFWLPNSPNHRVQGKVLEGLSKIQHTKPMLSAKKTKDVDEIKKFCEASPFYCSYKLDGLTLCVTFEDGKLVKAVTRGDGYYGEDVTEQARQISNIPSVIPYKEHLELRGECLISWVDFNEINNASGNIYSHPRNLAGGALRSLDTTVAKDKKLRYVVFECVSRMRDNKVAELGELDAMGFETVVIHTEGVDKDIAVLQASSSEYPVDGLIFEYISHAYSDTLSGTEHHPGHLMALKWADETYSTHLREVVWQTGRTGTIAPVAVFDPVDLGGAVTTRATLHNLSIIEGLELGIGDEITVYRANQVIPRIDDNLTRSNSLAIPTVCPCCGEPTKIVISEPKTKGDTNRTKTLTCTNDNCPARMLAKFEHFVSKPCANIFGLSSATLEALLSIGAITKYADIYHLDKYKDVITSMEGFGEKSYKKLIDSIEKSRDIELAKFIPSLGIYMIGKTAGRAISKYYGGNYQEFKRDWTNPKFDWTTFEGFGGEMSEALHESGQHPDKLWEGLEDELRFVVPVSSQKTDENGDGAQDSFIAGKTFVVTGAFNTMKRSDLETIITDRGGKLSGSVSKKTDYLLTNDGESGSSKAVKAKELNIPIMSEVEFLGKLGL